jgi:hypothetical protein
MSLVRSISFLTGSESTMNRGRGSGARIRYAHDHFSTFKRLPATAIKQTQGVAAFQGATKSSSFTRGRRRLECEPTYLLALRDRKLRNQLVRFAQSCLALTVIGHQTANGDSLDSYVAP